MKTSESKEFVTIICEAFFIFKQYLLHPSRTYFHFYKKGFLNSHAVRIWVKFREFFVAWLLVAAQRRGYAAAAAAGELALAARVQIQVRGAQLRAVAHKEPAVGAQRQLGVGAAPRHLEPCLYTHNH
jgi:hypothetical protein